MTDTHSISSARPTGAPSSAVAAGIDTGARIVGLARDPAVIYAYWDLSTSALEAARAQLGHGALASRLVLRTHEESLGTAPAPALPVVLEFDVSDADRDAFVRVNKPGTRQAVEIGLVGDDGSFASIARSATVAMPKAVPATWEPPEATRLRWRTIAAPTAALAAGATDPGTTTRTAAPRAAEPAAPAPDASAPTPSPRAARHELRVDFATQAASTSPRGAWSDSSSWAKAGPSVVGASEAWGPFPGALATRGSDVASPAGEGHVAAVDAHVRAPMAPAASGERAPRYQGAEWPPAESPAAPPLAAHKPSAVDPGRQTAGLEPASASVDVRGAQPAAAEGVWSSAEVGEVPPPTPITTALEKRPPPASLPATVPTQALVVASAGPPGWDQVKGGLGSLGRGLIQAAGGVLRVAAGVARLGGWAVRKALESLRDEKR